MTVYHQSAGRANEIAHFSDYNTQPRSGPTQSLDKEPWWPFRCRLNFEVAKLALKAALSRAETNCLISLLQCVQKGESLTLNNQADVSKTWEKAAETSTLTPVCIIIRRTKLTFCTHYILIHSFKKQK